MKKIYKNFTIVLLMTICAKFASFISELIIASLLGTTEKADAYSLIIGIHQMIYPMLNIGIWSIFLPIYKKNTSKMEQNKKNELINNVLTLFLLISSVIVIFILLFSNIIISIVGKGFSIELQNLCATLLRIYSPYFIFVIVSSVFAAVLQSEEKFFGSQIREVATYLPTIVFGPIFYKLFGINGLIIVHVFGGILRLIILIPFFDKKYKFRLKLNIKDKSIITIIKKTPSVLVTTAIEQINALIDKIMASSLIVGSVSSLSYGNKLINVFNGLFTSAVATTLYPTLNTMIINKDEEKLKKIVSQTIVAMGLLVIPISFLAVYFRTEIVTIVFARGKFNKDSIAITSMTFLGYLVGMFFVGIKEFINKVFYSYGDTKIIMNVSIICIIINIILNFILINYFNVSGLALATSIASIIYFVIAIVLLNKKNSIDFKKVVIGIFKTILISLGAILIVYIIDINITITNLVLNVIVLSLVFLFFYIIGIKFFRFQEIITISNYIKMMLKNKKIKQ